MKLQLNKAILRATLLYGCETCAVIKRKQTKLEIWEVGDIWEVHTDKEIYESNKEPRIIQVITENRIEAKVITEDRIVVVVHRLNVQQYKEFWRIKDIG